MAYKNIVFDLAGVVFFWKPQELIEEIFPHAEEQQLIAEKLFGHPDWLELDRGTLDVDEASERAASRTGLEMSRIATLLRRIPDHLRLNKQTLQLIKELKGKGLRLYCLSNMHTHSIDVLETRNDIWEAFDGIVISCRVGSIKPELAIYQHILERFDLEPTETVFTDDMLENLEAAAQLGITTIHFQSPDQCGRELEEILGTPGS